MSMVLEPNIYLRIVELKDCDKIFEWRNHQSIRRFSLDTNELDYESHKKWFKQVLSDEKRILLIAVQGGEDVGVIRYDLDITDRKANINVYVRPEIHGQRIGTKIMEAGEIWIRRNKPSLKIFTATVSAKNKISLKLFKKAGFSSEFIIFSKVLDSITS